MYINSSDSESTRRKTSRTSSSSSCLETYKLTQQTIKRLTTEKSSSLSTTTTINEQSPSLSSTTIDEQSASLSTNRIDELSITQFERLINETASLSTSLYTVGQLNESSPEQFQSLDNEQTINLGKNDDLHFDLFDLIENDLEADQSKVAGLVNFIVGNNEADEQLEQPSFFNSSSDLNGFSELNEPVPGECSLSKSVDEQLSAFNFNQQSFENVNQPNEREANSQKRQSFENVNPTNEREANSQKRQSFENVNQPNEREASSQKRQLFENVNQPNEREANSQKRQSISIREEDDQIESNPIRSTSTNLIINSPADETPIAYFNRTSCILPAKIDQLSDESNELFTRKQITIDDFVFDAIDGKCSD